MSGFLAPGSLCGPQGMFLLLPPSQSSITIPMRTKPVTTSSNKPANHELVIDELTEGLRKTAESVVPWFIQHMPPMYFQDTDYATQLSHLRAIIAAKASGRPLELTLNGEDNAQWTFVRPMAYPGVLADLVKELPPDPPPP